MSEDDRHDREEEQPPPPEWQGDRSGHQPTADGHPDGRRGRTEAGRDRGDRRGPDGEQGVDEQERDPYSDRRQGEPPGGEDDGSTFGSDRGGGGSDRSILRDALWVAAALAVAGLVLGLLPLTYGAIGEEPIVREAGEEPSEEISEEEQNEQAAQFNNQIVRLIVTIGPYLAVSLGLVVGFVVGTAGHASGRDAALVAGAGAFVGTVLFLLLSAGIAIEQWQTLEDGGGFLGAERSLAYGTALGNALAIAAPTALGAAAASSAGDRIAP